MTFHQNDFVCISRPARVTWGCLLSSFHFPVDISVGVDPVRSGSKWKRRAYCVSAKLLPNQAVSSISYRSPFLFKAVIQSWEKVCLGNSDSVLSFSAHCSWSSCVCVCVCVWWAITGQNTALLLGWAAFTPAVKVFSEYAAFALGVK